MTFNFKEVPGAMGGNRRLQSTDVSVHKSGISIGWEVWESLGKPKRLIVRIDQKEAALQLVNSTERGHSVNSTKPKNPEGYALRVSSTKIIEQLPPGRYVALEPSIFVHEHKHR